jgi:hypothetical protein
VVRHLEHVGPHHVVVDVAQQGVLLLGLRVAGEEHRDPTGARANQQTVVVRVRPGPGERAGRADDAQFDRAVPVAPADPDLGGRNRRGRGRPADRRLARGRLVEGRQDDRADGAAAQHAIEAADVVRVEVGDDEQGDDVHVQAPQAAVDRRRVRTGVDEHRRARTVRQHDGVALADVARHHHRARRRPVRPGPAERNDADRDAQRAHREDAPQHRTPDGHDDRAGHGGQQQGAGEAGRPADRSARNAGAGVRDRHQPPGGPGRQPGQAGGASRPQRGQHGRPDAQHRGRRHRWRGQAGWPAGRRGSPAPTTPR